MSGLPTYVGHVDSLGPLYRGGGSWDGLWASLQTLLPWHASPWSSPMRGAGSGLMQRRTGRVGLVKVSGKTNRRRRQYLNRARKANQRRARERSREALRDAVR